MRKVFLAAAMAFLGMVMATASPVYAKSHKGARKAGAHSMSASHTAVDPECVSRQEAAIKKCGKNKKCRAKHEKLKKKCYVIRKPAETPAVRPLHPAPGAVPGHLPPGAVYNDQVHHSPVPYSPAPPVFEEKESGGILQRTAPQPTGRSPGIKVLPENTYSPPWMR